MPMAETLVTASPVRASPKYNANRAPEAALCRLRAVPDLMALQPFQTWPQA